MEEAKNMAKVAAGVPAKKVVADAEKKEEKKEKKQEEGKKGPKPKKKSALEAAKDAA